MNCPVRKSIVLVYRIHYAVSNGDVVMFDLLENAGASCRSVVGPNENTLLHWFCSHASNDQHMSLLKRLINLGCDINAVNNDQQTPLMFAARLNMINTCHYLLDFEARLDSVDSNGERAIDFAVKHSECWILFDQESNGVKRQPAQSQLLGTNSMKISRRNPYQDSFHGDDGDDIFEMKIHRFSHIRSDDDCSNDEPDMKYARMLEELQEREARASNLPSS